MYRFHPIHYTPTCIVADLVLGFDRIPWLEYAYLHQKQPWLLRKRPMSVVRLPRRNLESLPPPSSGGHAKAVHAARTVSLSTPSSGGIPPAVRHRPGHIWPPNPESLSTPSSRGIFLAAIHRPGGSRFPVQDPNPSRSPQSQPQRTSACQRTEYSPGARPAASPTCSLRAFPRSNAPGTPRPSFIKTSLSACAHRRNRTTARQSRSPRLRVASSRCSTRAAFGPASCSRRRSTSSRR